MATLFRPVGLPELALIWDSEFRGFPPRLSHQPLFYPVLNADYARQIAAEWNVKDEQSEFAGFVTRFDVADDYLSRLEPHVVGTHKHVEYWVASDDLPSFNRAIIQQIAVSEAFFGGEFQGYVPLKLGLRGKDAVEQFVALARTLDYSGMDFSCEVSANAKAIYLNGWFWVQHDFTDRGIDSLRKAKVLDALHATWQRHGLWPSFPSGNL